MFMQMFRSEVMKDLDSADASEILVSVLEQSKWSARRVG
jgi:hypothetical protein